MPPKKDRHGHVFQVRAQPPQSTGSEPMRQNERQVVLRTPRQCRFVQDKNTQSSFPDHSNPFRSTPCMTEPSRSVVFAVNKTTTDFAQQAGQHPQKPPRKRQKMASDTLNGCTTALTARRPVKTYVPIDAWALILSRSHPKFLLRARLVCRDFYEILTHQTIWKQAREHTFGENIPPCPDGVTEFQYASLLVGRGCQVKPCHRRETRKCFWPFMLRACEECFSKVTQVLPDTSSEEAKAYEEYRRNLDIDVQETLPKTLGDLLPAGAIWFGRWTGIRRMDEDSKKWLQDWFKHCVLASDYAALRKQFAAEVMVEPSTFHSWARKIWAQTRKRMKIAKLLKNPDHDAVNRREPLREEKEQYFRQKAKELDPPMGPEVLQRMAAYHSIVDNGNPPSQRSWDMLSARINVPELRAQADQLIAWDIECSRDWWFLDEIRPKCGKDSLWDTLAQHRSHPSSKRPDKKFSKEQQVVINIAEEELKRILDVVDDEDVLLLFLEAVRKAYEALPRKPIGLNGDGKSGEYRLLLDDARMVVNEVLIPRTERMKTSRLKQILASLRCIGCTRSDANKLYNFESLIIHIRNTHAKRVGQDMHFWKLAVPAHSGLIKTRDNVAWYRIPWPKSMPALPSHQKASPGISWDPSKERTYVRRTVQSVGLFENVELCHYSSVPQFDFQGNFCLAMRELVHTRLDSLSMFSIAFEYAEQRRASYTRFCARPPHLSIAMLEDLQKLCHGVSARLDLAFKCGLCMKNMNSGGGLVLWGTDILSLEELIPHWSNRHELSVTEVVSDLICLRTGSELQQTMQELDAKLEAQQKRARVRARRLATEQNQLTPDPRTVALLSIPSIRSRFDRLFTRLHAVVEDGTCVLPLDDGMGSSDEESVSENDDD